MCSYKNGVSQLSSFNSRAVLCGYTTAQMIEVYSFKVDTDMALLRG
jgi:hypothetical protein